MMIASDTTPNGPARGMQQNTQVVVGDMMAISAQIVISGRPDWIRQASEMVVLRH